MTDIIKNKNYEMVITGMTHESQGVGRINNLAVFVDGALKGETVEIRIIKTNKSYAVGKLLNVIIPSSNRVKPFCPAFEKCGGCSLQHLNYPAQLEFKTGLVQETLKRLGKLENVTVHDTIGMSRPVNYRNKAQFPVGTDQNNPVIGFYAKRSHRIIESELCAIQDIYSDRIRTAVKTFIREKGISTYDEESGKGLLRHVMTRVAFKTGEVMAVLVINGSKLPYSDELVSFLLSEVPQISSIYININTKASNVILGERNIKLHGKDSITDYIGKYKFNISPPSFFQVNPMQTEVLYSKALEYAGLTGSETVFDLYCGIGTISLFLSEKAKKVYGVEVVSEAIDDARENARLNGVSNVEFMAGEAEKVIPQVYAKGVKADVVVVDPPRKGCDETLLKTLVDMSPERIVYVSCNPSTLARDLKYLSENGFSVAEVQPVDMFPYTGHVECVTSLKKF